MDNIKEHFVVLNKDEFVPNNWLKLKKGGEQLVKDDLAAGKMVSADGGVHWGKQINAEVAPVGDCVVIRRKQWNA